MMPLTRRHHGVITDRAHADPPRPMHL